jgi:hypothetical protein
MAILIVISHKPCQYLQTGAAKPPLTTTLTRLSQTLAKVLFKNNPNIGSSKGARIPGHWTPGTINYFDMEPNVSGCYVYTQSLQFACTEQKALHSSPVHRLLQNFGFSVWKLNVTILEPRIWGGFLILWKSEHSYKSCNYITTYWKTSLNIK